MCPRKLQVSHRPKVLLVDDDPGQRELLGGRFRSAGYAVTVTPGAQQALEAIDRESVDIMVTDVQMPGLSGLDLLRKLRGRFPIILISGGMTPAIRKEAMAAGATAVYSKPVPWTELLEQVKDSHENGQRRPRVILAEDHEPTRIFLKRTLQREGYAVEVAEDGVVAFQMALAARPPYDLLITDTRLSKMGGPEVIRKIRGLDGGTHMVFTSGAGGPVEIRAGSRGGAVTLWRKPFELKELTADLRRLKEAPAEEAFDEETGNFSAWLEGLKEEIREDAGKKVALPGAGGLLIAGLLAVILVGWVLYSLGTLGGAIDRAGAFMERVVGDGDRDEARGVGGTR